MPKDAANTLAKSALEAIRQTDARGAQKVYNQLLNNNLMQQLENLQANTVKSLQEDVNPGLKDMGANDASTKGSVNSTTCRCGSTKTPGKLMCSACKAKALDRQ